MAFDFRYPTPLPSTKGWGPGWPNCQRDVIVPHDVFAPGLHEDIVELVDILVAFMRSKGFEFMDPGCWGFACKDGGSGTPSFHSWGLAIDINAPRNVWRASESTSEIATTERWVVALLRDYGFFWLGPAIADWMHFSFCGSPADARAMTEKARRELLPRLEEDQDEMAYADFKRGAQLYLKRFREKGADPGPAPDAMRGDRRFGYTVTRSGVVNGEIPLERVAELEASFAAAEGEPCDC